MIVGVYDHKIHELYIAECARPILAEPPSLKQEFVINKLAVTEECSFIFNKTDVALDVIVLDIEQSSLLKSLQATKTILLTNHTPDEGDIALASHFNVLDVIQRPVNLEDLQTFVQKALSNSEFSCVSVVPSSHFSLDNYEFLQPEILSKYSANTYARLVMLLKYFKRYLPKISDKPTEVELAFYKSKLSLSIKNFPLDVAEIAFLNNTNISLLLENNALTVNIF